MSTNEDNTSMGCVKWFDTKKGYGFLTNLDSNEDVFIHYTSIETDDDIYKMLYEGEYVSYESKKDGQGRLVTDKVTGLKGGKLLCENEFFKKLNSNNRRNRSNKDD